jgi:hypothetical protein
MSHSELETRVLRLERQRRLTGLVAICFAVFGALVWVQYSQADEDIDPQKTIRVRQLVVEDENGVERIIIAAPTPDKVGRRAKAYGIQFHDEKGHERGGLGMSEDGRIMIVLDHQHSEAAGMFAFPDGMTGLLLSGKPGKPKMQLIIHPDGTAGIALIDAEDNRRGWFGLNAEGQAEFLISDAEGKKLFRAP